MKLLRTNSLLFKKNLKKDRETFSTKNNHEKKKNHYTVPKEFDFPRYNMKCSWENVILNGIVHVFHYITCYIAEIWITFRTG